MSRRAPALLVLLLLCLPGAVFAHVGSPTVFFEGAAGPWPVRVMVRPPGVVPGLAEVTVRVKQGTPRRVTVQPVQWNAGLRGAPPADEARPVPGDPGAWSGQLWMMTTGSYSVRVTIEGAAGRGLAVVPVTAARMRTLPMQRALGAVLAVLGLLLTAGAATIVGAAVRESVLPPGEEPDARRRRRARTAVVVTALVLVLTLFGGKRWWDGVDAEARASLFRPYHATAVVGPEGAARVLRLAIDDPRWDERQTKSLLTDHGKLMHLFLIREPGLDAFAHLHPVPAAPGDQDRFEVSLPGLPAGRYRLYADVVLDNGFAQTLTARIDLPPSPEGTPGEASGGPPPDADDSWRISAPPAAGQTVSSPLGDGEVMTWEGGGRPLVAGRDVELRFTVRDAAGLPAALEPYMGMLSHAVISRLDGQVFVHLHPVGTYSMAAEEAFLEKEPEAAPGMAGMQGMRGMPGMSHGAGSSPVSEVSLPYAFPQPGRYRFWIQVKTGGQVRTGVFDAEVSGKSAATP
jgi:hypothetical protein